MDILSACVDESRIQIARMEIEGVFDSHDLVRCLSSKLRAFFMLTGHPETATEVPE